MDPTSGKPGTIFLRNNEMDITGRKRLLFLVSVTQKPRAWGPLFFSFTHHSLKIPGKREPLEFSEILGVALKTEAICLCYATSRSDTFRFVHVVGIAAVKYLINH